MSLTHKGSGPLVASVISVGNRNVGEIRNGYAALCRDWLVVQVGPSSSAAARCDTAEWSHAAARASCVAVFALPIRNIVLIAYDANCLVIRASLRTLNPAHAARCQHCRYGSRCARWLHCCRGASNPQYRADCVRCDASCDSC